MFFLFFPKVLSKGGGVFFGRYVTLWVLWIGAKRLVFFFFGFMRFIYAAYTYVNVLRFPLARGRFFLGILCIWGSVWAGLRHGLWFGHVVYEHTWVQKSEQRQ